MEEKGERLRLTTDTFARDIHNNFQSHPDDLIKCKCCDFIYIRGDWDFYNLCDPCFKVFDAQKMRARWALAGQFMSTGSLKPVQVDSTEDVEEFIKAGVCPHG